ncbi:hypothetical protein P7D85_07350 [Enterococcus hulanensis]|uniref:Uncharacterized protein n=1 Tax=Enterococcus hulanensis TaxID=2559929 RepID=A0ABU3EXI9_9ENTE|nr:hypothetical protein [Enterococcus hulanensis]MDT2599585.1 hypothetical protein [Enterococcus hulanensis]MDT2609559.1 hypothetical protein [Enterococcus hulanensis]MDT2616136.1 hypothetical protein [Enterococcus hulanensis]MDT2627824.1 hypothetical protein [Enterococcus hulanensis]MDT2654929.1 hypothetical protein [Enterococcus hulanensis]
MRYITEQELQQKYRSGKLQQLALLEDERLTPGASQFLSDHQIPLVTSDSANTFDKAEDGKLAELAIISKRETFFPLLEIELWEAALKTSTVHSASAKRITELAQSVNAIRTETFSELSFEISEDCEVTQFGPVEAVSVFRPGGKTLLKLRRAVTFAATLQTCVSPEQKSALNQLTCLIKQEIDQLEKL